jgi:DNA-binding MarR family transcriptional regulator
VFPVSDVTRLLDRLVDMGLVVRTRGREDRRVVLSRITDAGFDRIAPLDSVIERLHRRQLGRLGPRKLRELLALLAEARESIRAAVGE